MRNHLCLTFLCAAVAAGSLVQPSVALAQEENPDFKILAKFRDANDESVGHARVRVKSRFLQVYYGGVSRKDEYRFELQLDSQQYANRSFDFLVDDYFVGTHTVDGAGFLDLTYRSDFKPDDAPDLPLPTDFPDPIDVGNTAWVLDSLTGEVVLSSVFGEEFRRGDSNEDGSVDLDDYNVRRDGYGANYLGPANGDYNGDGRVNGADYTLWRDNASSPGALAAITQGVPEPTAGLLACPLLVAAAAFRRRSSCVAGQAVPLERANDA
ncbi:MAG: hypothetical protein KDA37_12160 [Planctomycetales bacterium]|nr:hypothetical protein [Planctomycetales bacterium]